MMRMKKFVLRYQANIKRLISFCLFMALLFIVFSRITYLFRNTDANRLSMIGLQCESNLDMIYVGGSSVYTYWEPLKAWDDYGFTSYAYATDNLPSDSTEFYIKEALKTQDPKLFVVELKAFSEFDPEVFEYKLRNGSDSLDWYSINRWKYISNYLTYHPADENTDVLSLYFDIVKYHANHSCLSDPLNWEYCDNEAVCYDKGFRLMEGYEKLDKPVDYMTEERYEMPPEDTELLNHLLDYCDKRNLQVLFVLSPMVVDAAQMGIYNTMQDIVEKRGYGFLNANEYYDEMSIDFSTDFINARHVNCYGAEKYTRFLGKYIIDHYDMPDNRDNVAYTSWHEDFARFSEEEAFYKYKTDRIIQNYETSLAYEQEIKEETDFQTWKTLISEPRYYVFTAQKNTDLSSLNTADVLAAESLGINDDVNGCAVSHSSVIEERSDGNYKLSGTLLTGANDNIVHAYEVDNIDELASIVIDGVEYSRMEEGINVVVLDTILGRVIDSVTLGKTDGYIHINR